MCYSVAKGKCASGNTDNSFLFPPNDTTVMPVIRHAQDFNAATHIYPFDDQMSVNCSSLSDSYEIQVDIPTAMDTST